MKIISSIICLICILIIPVSISAQIPMNQRDPNAGIWIAYPKFPLSQYPNMADIKGIMVWENWKDIYVSNTNFNWTSLDSDLNKIINSAGKKAFIDVASGYCPDPVTGTGSDLNWPQFLRDRIARHNIVNEQHCYPLQFWDPLYLNYNTTTNTYSGYYWDYIKALAAHLADYDKNRDGRPNTTDITIVRASPMAATMENLPNVSEINNGEWQANNFIAASNGRIYNVDLTETLMLNYHKMVGRAYKKALDDVYKAAAVNLPPPAVGSKSIAYWGVINEDRELASEGLWFWTTNSNSYSQGWFYGMVDQVKNGVTRGHDESGQHPQVVSLFGQRTYWEVLQNLHSGVESIGIYGKNTKNPTEQPLGPVGYPANFEILRFGNTYAGVEREPATAPGAFIALRGWYPENRWSGIEHEYIWSDYYVLMTHYRPQDSLMLFGTNETHNGSPFYPEVKRSMQRPTSGWTDEISTCIASTKYPDSECDFIYQQPTVYLGTDTNNKYIYSYPVSDLGKIRYCGEDMYCNDMSKTMTKEETMAWARQTNKASGNNYMRFNLNDLFANSLGTVGNRRVTVRVVYLDRGGSTNKWQLQYAAVGNPNKPATITDTSTTSVTKGTSNYWKEVFFTINDGAFDNSATGGTDLALYNNDDDDDIFHLIEVKRTTSPVTITPIRGDTNNDQLVNIVDLNTFLMNYKKNNATRIQGNVNADTVVNALDGVIILTDWKPQ